MARPLVVAYGALGVALYLDNGALGPVSLPLVLVACVVVARAVAGRPSVRAPRLDLPRVVALVLVAEAVLAWPKPPGVYLGGGAYAARALVTLVALGGAAAALTARRVPGWLALAGLLALAGAAGVLVIAASPAPTIDVFTIQQEGARDLWQGIDPYGASYHNPYTPEQTLAFFGAPQAQLSHYPYPPLSLYVTAAAWRVAGDVRYAFLLLQLATGAGLFALARRHRASPGLALAFAALFLAHPRGLFVLEQAWTEPLICAGFVVSLWLLGGPAGRARWLALVAALAVMFAAKQYSVLLLPVWLARRFAAGTRGAVVAAVAIAGAVAIPLALWDPRALFADVVMFQIQQPFRWASLSLGPVIAFVSGWKPSLLGPVAALATMVWSWRRTALGAPGLALVASATLLAFFVTAKQAFCNYYYFAGLVLLCAAITAAGARDGTPATSPTPAA